MKMTRVPCYHRVVLSKVESENGSLTIIRRYTTQQCSAGSYELHAALRSHENPQHDC